MQYFIMAKTHQREGKRKRKLEMQENNRRISHLLVLLVRLN